MRTPSARGRPLPPSSRPGSTKWSSAQQRSTRPSGTPAASWPQRSRVPPAARARASSGRVSTARWRPRRRRGSARRRSRGDAGRSRSPALSPSLALAAGGFVLPLAGGDDDPPTTGSQGSSGAALAADVTDVPVGDAVDAIVVGKKNVIATSSADNSLYAIDPDSAKIVRGPEGVDAPACARHRLRLGLGRERQRRSGFSGSASATVEIPARIHVGADPADIAVDERWVWVANRGNSSVSRVDPTPAARGRDRGSLTRRARSPPPRAPSGPRAPTPGSLQAIDSSSVSAKAPKIGGQVSRAPLDLRGI